MTDSANQLVALDAVTKAFVQHESKPAFYRALDQALQGLIGHKLFTVLAALPDGVEVQRVWSSDETAYPLTGRKTVGPTPWGAVVLKQRTPWLGTNMEAMRWAFSDHELIASLGLGSAINIPVVFGNRLLGTMNVLHEEHHYNEDHVALAQRFGPYLAPLLADELMTMADLGNKAFASSTIT